MSKDEIIKNWKSGKTVQQIAKIYTTNQLKNGVKIKPEEAQKHVEKTILEYQRNR